MYNRGMLDIPLILRARRRRRSDAFTKHHPRLGIAALLGVNLLLLIAVFSSVLVYSNLVSDLPSLEQLQVLLAYPAGQLWQPTTLYDRTGLQVIARLENPAAQDRQYLTLEGDPSNRLPLNLVDATLVAADPDFWQHPGYVLNDWEPDNHPTLAQKLVHELLLSEEPASLRRSVRERILAGQATSQYGQAQMLEWYLNQARYGELVYGADAAARVYFGKSASRLTLAEAAALAAIEQLPGISPYQAPQVIREHSAKILQGMWESGMITASQRQEASQDQLVFLPAVQMETLSPAFVELVLEQLAPFIPRQRLEHGGFKVITTLDYELQTQVNCTREIFLNRYSETASPVSQNSSLDTACPAARLLPTISQGISATLPDLQGTIIVSDPRTGQILSLADSSLPGVPAGESKHPTGTLALPFLYLNAFSRGFSPGSLAWDIPSEYETLAQDTYQGPVRLRTALVNDYLAPASQLIIQFGLDTTLNTARQLGAFRSGPAGNQDNSPIAPGALERLLAEPASLLEMVQAYAILDHQGLAAGQVFPVSSGGAESDLKPYSVLRLENSQHQIWLDWSEPVRKTVLSPQLAYLLNHSLSDEVARWNSLGHPNPFEIGRPAAVKAGQTTAQRDAWAVGYTPQRLVGVWLGVPESGTAIGIPTHAAAALWHAVIQYSLRNLPAEGWVVPPGISQVQVCDPSGLLPTIHCPQTAAEVFLTGTEPTQADNLYQLYQINRETGRLATVFTRPELIEEKVFMIVPAEARTWAEQAGLPTPPEDFDFLAILPSENTTVNLSSPAMFSHVHGMVTLTGSAEGSGFEFYRLFYGQGLNPQQWFQIGTDARSPVKGGKLGVWDTQGLDGLYALQLQVVRLEQRVETALIQVTVDNTPPEVSLLSPMEGVEFELALQPNLVFHASASDNIELAQVAFLIDDRLIATLSAPPYLIAWVARLGEYTLTATATDMAGNQTTTQVDFKIK